MFRRFAAMALMLALITANAGAMELYAGGDPVADFTLKLTDGTDFTLSACKGKAVVIDLWTTWCEGCVSYSLPALDALAAAYPDDVAVLAVNCGDAARDVEDFAAQSAYAFPMAADEELNILYNWFPTTEIPYCVFIDRQGNFSAAIPGADKNTAQTYADALAALLGQ